MDELAEDWSKIMTSYINKYTPSKIIRVCENQKKWVTKALLKLRSKKKKAFKKAKKSRKEKNHPIWDRFKKLNIDYKDELDKAKKEYLDKIGEKMNNPSEVGSKEWWKLSKEAYGKNKKEAIPPLEVNGELV